MKRSLQNTLRQSLDLQESCFELGECSVITNGTSNCTYTAKVCKAPRKSEVAYYNKEIGGWSTRTSTRQSFPVPPQPMPDGQVSFQLQLRQPPHYLRLLWHAPLTSVSRWIPAAPPSTPTTNTKTSSSTRAQTTFRTSASTNPSGTDRVLL